jgi:hypothetical protein
VNHQVENHVNIQAARAESAEPVNLKKQRPPGYGFGGYYSGIEPLEVPDLQDAATALGKSRHFLRFLHGPRNGLLEENIHIVGESLVRHFGVARGRNNHGYGARRLPYLVQVREGSNSQFRRHFPRFFRPKVVDTYEVRSRELFQYSGMLLAVLPYSDDSYGNSIAHLVHLGNWKMENGN